VYVLDGAMQPAPTGVAGELYIGGAGVARGYLNRPELTAERFVSDPFASEPARLYRTGDLARWRDDGTLEFLGRNDHQVKIRGFRIELGEIEARLLEHPGVREAVVLARERASGDKQLVAYVTGEDALTPEALRGHLAAQLPEYMLPAAYVQLDALPLTPNGKLDRGALPAPKADALVTRPYERPQGEIEQMLAELWCELFQLERIGRHDNFFELGGHSLMALQMLSRVSARLQREVPVRLVFAAQTVETLARGIGEMDAGDMSNLVPIRAGSLSPLFIVHAGDGEVGYAFDLAPHLPAERPLYALAAVGFGDGEVPLTGVEAMARIYVRAMRQVQPHGPYRVVGWSAGGVIAYEMAAQLLSQGERVVFVGLIDTTADCSGVLYEGAEAPTEAQSVVGSGQELPTEAKFMVNVLRGETVGDDLVRQLDVLAQQDDIDAMLDLCQARGVIPATIERATLRHHLAVRYGIGLAVAQYRPRPIPVLLSLFTAADQGRPDPRLGWDEIVGPGLEVVELPGTHLSITGPDHVGALGSAISQALAARECAGSEYRDPEDALSVIE
jgi:thioesterase domain-containing protein